MQKNDNEVMMMMSWWRW